MGQVYGWTVEDIEKRSLADLDYLYHKIKRDRDEEKQALERMSRGR